MDARRTIRLIIEYDGTRYAGWQVQPGARTIQGELERAAERILHHPVRLVAAGRTDAGVHATGQVAGFGTESDMPANRLHRALNGVLPRDIAVVETRDAEPGFNARYDARARTYRYTISDRKVAVGRKYAWHVKYPLSRELLEAAARPLNGPCNLRGFSKGVDSDDFSTIIYHSGWTFQGQYMIFEIRAIRFFHHAVRSMVGTAVEVARGKAAPDIVERLLAEGDRSLAGPTAPACGLCLTAVEYGK